jgi:hypothetical protein
MSCALVPVPNTTTERPAHSRPVLKRLECSTCPPKFSIPSIRGMFGVPLTLLASTMCFGRKLRRAPSRTIRAVQRCVASSYSAPSNVVRVQTSSSMIET